MDRHVTVSEYLKGYMDGSDNALDTTWEIIVTKLAYMRMANIITERQENLIRAELHKLFY